MFKKTVIAPELVDPFMLGRCRITRMHPRRDEGGHDGGGGDGAAGGSGATGGTGGEGDGKPEKTFTQADVDRIVQGRLSKYADYDSLKSELDELKSKHATAQEREIEKVRNETRAEILASANQRLIQAETRGIASELGFHAPDKASLYLENMDGFISGDDIDTAALKAQLEQVAKDHPYLVKDSGPASHTDVGIGRRGDAPDPGPGPARLEAAFDAAYRTK